MEVTQLATVFAALADPTRLSILQRLTDGDAKVGDLARPFAMSQPAISRHLKVLENAGLISRSSVATARFSHLEAQPMKEATEYLERYRRFWNANFDRLDEALARYQLDGDSAPVADTAPVADVALPQFANRDPQHETAATGGEPAATIDPTTDGTAERDHR